jgi:hypothetical protein
MYWLVVWLVWFRFPSDNRPGIKASCGHRGSNRQQDKRKTEGEPMGLARLCKPKESLKKTLFHAHFCHHNTAYDEGFASMQLIGHRYAAVIRTVRAFVIRQNQIWKIWPRRHW